MSKRCGRYARGAAALGCWLGLSAAAFGQSGMTSSPNDGSSPAVAARQARIDQEVQEEQAAASAFNAGRYDEAIADAGQALAITDADLRPQEIVAQALEAQGKTREALVAYQALADRGSCYPSEMIPYALLLLRRGQWRGALAAYEKALPLMPQGILLRADNDFSPASPQPVALEAALHVARGLLLSTGNAINPYPQHAKALAEYEKALALAPDSALAHFYHGYGLKRLNRRAEAKAEFDKAVQLGGDNVKAEAAKFAR